MRAYVFTDAALTKHAGRFVWLSVDTEKEKNAAFQEKYPISAWPTLLVIDPQREAVVLKWLGSANASDLGGLLDDGARALDPSHADQASKTLAAADAAEARDDHASAAKLYKSALDQGGANWHDAPRVLQSLDFALQETNDLAGCSRLARERAPTMQQGSAYANLVATGLQCASDSPASPARTDALQALVPLAEGALKIPNLLGDDRSSIYETLVDLRDHEGDAAGKKKLALEWMAFLESEAAKAKTPQERAAFDPHRVEAAITLGDPGRALPALQHSEKDLPDDYNPPAREAIVYMELGKLDDALAANNRALQKVYGPRTLRVLSNRAEIYTRMQKPAEARKTLQDAIAFAEKLPAGQRNPHSIERLKKDLAALDAKK